MRPAENLGRFIWTNAGTTAGNSTEATTHACVQLTPAVDILEYHRDHPPAHRPAHAA